MAKGFRFLKLSHAKCRDTERRRAERAQTKDRAAEQSVARRPAAPWGGVTALPSVARGYPLGVRGYGGGWGFGGMANHATPRPGARRAERAQIIVAAGGSAQGWAAIVPTRARSRERPQPLSPATGGQRRQGGSWRGSRGTPEGDRRGTPTSVAASCPRWPPENGRGLPPWE